MHSISFIELVYPMADADASSNLAQLSELQCTLASV